MVRRIRLDRGYLRNDRKQLRRHGPEDIVHVLVGACISLERIGTGPEHVEVDHGIDLTRIGERAVEEIPCARIGLLRRSERNEQNRAPEYYGIGIDHPGEFNQRR